MLSIREMKAWRDTIAAVADISRRLAEIDENTRVVLVRLAELEARVSEIGAKNGNRQRRGLGRD